MILLNRDNPVSLYEQLYMKIKRQIRTEKMLPGEKLQPIRTFASTLGVSINTVNRAYQQLLSEGYIRAIQGSGYYVADQQSDLVNRPHLDAKDKAKKTKRTAAKRTENDYVRYDFRYRSYESQTFPWNKWQHHVNTAITELSYAPTVSYEPDNRGNLLLRQILCNYLNKYRGVMCTPDQVVLCPGEMYALDIIMKILPQKPYIAGTEDPCHSSMRLFFYNYGIPVRQIPVTDTGIDTALMKKSDCNLLYLTPSHQFPTGATLSLEKRQEVLRWGRQKGAYIIENDFDCEYNFGDRSLPAIQALGSAERVIYVNTFSRIISPQVRCAYIVLPPAMVHTFEKKYKPYYSSLSSYEQRALAHFIRGGDLEKQIRKLTALNKRKLDIIKRVFDTEMHEEIYYPPATGGNYILIRVNGCTSAKKMMEHLQARGIWLDDAGSFFHAFGINKQNRFLVGFGAIPIERLEKACRALVSGIRGYLYGES